MNKSKKFSPEVRERAVRMVLEHRGEYPSLWTAVESIAPKIGCVPQTLLTWVKQHEIDAGTREGVTTAEAKRVKELERFNTINHAVTFNLGLRVDFVRRYDRIFDFAR